jgi:hypothetical protein
MNATDVAALSGLLVRARQVVANLKDLARIPPIGDVEDLRAELGALETDLGDFTSIYQRRIAVAWGQRHPPTSKRPVLPANRYLTSNEIEPDAPVDRYDLHGHRAGETPARQPLSGRWGARYGTCRRKRA